jgi:hypothetical protein
MYSFALAKIYFSMVSLTWKWTLLLLFSFIQPDAATSVKLYHPFYISVTEISHNATVKTLEISCKAFADDLEKTLDKANRNDLDINAEKDKQALQREIAAYFHSHLSLAVDGKPVGINFIGYEVEKESAYCYFEVENVPSFRKLDVTNRILHDFTTEQINIIHCVAGGKRQSTKLNYPESKATFAF